MAQHIFLVIRIIDPHTHLWQCLSSPHTHLSTTRSKVKVHAKVYWCIGIIESNLPNIQPTHTHSRMMCRIRCASQLSARANDHAWRRAPFIGELISGKAMAITSIRDSFALVNITLALLALASVHSYISKVIVTHTYFWSLDVPKSSRDCKLTWKYKKNRSRIHAEKWDLPVGLIHFLHWRLHWF